MAQFADISRLERTAARFERDGMHADGARVCFNLSRLILGSDMEDRLGMGIAALERCVAMAEKSGDMKALTMYVMEGNRAMFNAGIGAGDDAIRQRMGALYGKGAEAAERIHDVAASSTFRTVAEVLLIPIGDDVKETVAREADDSEGKAAVLAGTARDAVQDPASSSITISELINQAERQRALGYAEEAERYYRRAIDVAPNPETVARLVDALINCFEELGDDHVGRGMLERSESYHRKAISIAREFGLGRKAKGIEGKLIGISERLGQREASHDALGEAEKHYRKAIDLDNEFGAGGRQRLVNAVVSIFEKSGDTHARYNNINAAEKEYRWSLSLAHEFGNMELHAREITKILTLFENAGDFEKSYGRRSGAAEYYRRGLEAATEFRHADAVRAFQQKLEGMGT